ncbi:MAG: hypothetical protein RR572_04780, partial [Raoultibacter sp.]
WNTLRYSSELIVQPISAKTPQSDMGRLIPRQNATAVTSLTSTRKSIPENFPLGVLRMGQWRVHGKAAQTWVCAAAGC